VPCWTIFTIQPDRVTTPIANGVVELLMMLKKLLQKNYRLLKSCLQQLYLNKMMTQLLHLVFMFTPAAMLQMNFRMGQIHLPIGRIHLPIGRIHLPMGRIHLPKGQIQLPKPVF